MRSRRGALVAAGLAYAFLAISVAIGAMFRWDGQAAFLVIPFICGMYIACGVSVMLCIVQFGESKREATLILLLNVPALCVIAYTNYQEYVRPMNGASPPVIRKQEQASVDAMAFRTTYVYDLQRAPPEHGGCERPLRHERL